MNFLDNALSFLFPKTCGICEKVGERYICKNCEEKLIASNLFLNKIDNNLNNYIDEHYYLFNYAGIIREKIIQYKFNNKPYLSDLFSEFFVKNEKVCGFLKKYDIIIAVPISRLRLSNRGYNQSKIIAKKIGKTKIITFESDILIKEKDNKIQSSLNKEQRLKNVKNVYKIDNKQKINRKNIILFDDIYTTGATANECAKILKQSGANRVGVLTIAKDFQKIKVQTKG